MYNTYAENHVYIHIIYIYKLYTVLMGVHALYYVMGDTAQYCLVLFSMVYGGLGMKRERNRNE